MASRKWSEFTAGGALAGTEKFPGLDGTTNKTWLASQLATYITALIVDAAPSTLDTLNELAAALGDDPNFAATVTAALATKQPLDTDLTAIAALSTTSFGRSLLEATNAAALRILAGTVIGTDVQAYHANLGALSGLAGAPAKIAYFTGSGAMALADYAVPAPIPTGRWMSGEGAGLPSNAATAPGASNLSLYPVVIRRAITITDIKMYISTSAASGNVQFGVYASSATTGAPTGAPLYNSASQSTTSTGEIGTTGLTVVLVPGVYWFAAMCDASAATAVFRSRSAGAAARIAEIVGCDTATDALATTPITGWRKSAITFGTWPTLTGSYSGDSLAQVQAASVPMLTFKA